MKKTRPVNLDLTTIKFPITAISSILHRISGVILFVMMPFLLYLLQQSLYSAEQFDLLADHMSGFFIKFLVWGTLSALLYHLVAGVRHIIMDMGFGESLAGGRLGSKLVIGLSLILAVLVGVWIW